MELAAGAACYRETGAGISDESLKIAADADAAFLGAMGMAPCAEIGDAHGVFQPSHGSTPDIMGQDRANPVAMMLSAAMMLDWLGERHGVEPAGTAADILRESIYRGFAAGRIRPMEFGGPDGMASVTATVIDLVKTAN